MKMVLLAALGGAVGAAGRYLLGVGAARAFGLAFPWGTLIVNIAGCFLMGVLIALLALRFSVGHEVRVFLATGILGGFTTFSAFALDVVTLAERKQLLEAGLYLGATVVLSILGLYLGLWAVRVALS